MAYFELVIAKPAESIIAGYTVNPISGQTFFELIFMEEEDARTSADGRDSERLCFFCL